MLSDALNYAIFMSLKFKYDIDSTTFNNSMEENENFVFESSCLISNLKKTNCWVFGLFSFHLNKIWKKNLITCFHWCWTRSLRPFVLCPHLLLMNKCDCWKIWLKKMISYSFLSVIIIYILWLNLKWVLLIIGLKRTTIWIYLWWQPT